MIIIINGSLGVGKSSVAESLMWKVPNSAMIEGDAIGRVNPFITYDEARIANLYEAVTYMVGHHKEHGFGRVVIDYIFESPESLEQLLLKLRPLDSNIKVYWLTCDTEVQAQRIRERGRPSWKWELQRYVELQGIQARAAASGFMGQHIDTTTMSAEEIADFIIAETSEGATPSR